MWIADVGVNEPLEDIGTDEASLVTSQRDYEEVAYDNREWEKSADALDYVSKLLSGEFKLSSKEDHQ